MTLENKRIFITGGTGFFGKSLLDYLRCHPIHGLQLVLLTRDPATFFTRNPEFSALPGVSLLAGDVRNFTLNDYAFDYIIHAATTSGMTVSDAETRSVVLDGTARVLKFAQQCSRLQRLLYVSSGAVYGPQAANCAEVTEDHPCAPVTVYGQAKFAAEKLCQTAGVNVTIARGFAFVGKYLPREAHFAIGNFIRDALSGQDIVVNGDGTPYRSYLYADDLAEWLLTLLLRGRDGRAYNVGSATAVSIAELAGIVNAELRPGGNVIVRGTPTGLPPARYVPSVARAERELGLRVKVSLSAAIRRTVGK